MNSTPLQVTKILQGQSDRQLQASIIALPSFLKLWASNAKRLKLGRVRESLALAHYNQALKKRTWRIGLVADQKDKRANLFAAMRYAGERQAKQMQGRAKRWFAVLRHLTHHQRIMAKLRLRFARATATGLLQVANNVHNALCDGPHNSLCEAPGLL